MRPLLLPLLALTLGLGPILAGCGSTAHVRTGDPMKDLLSPDPLIVRAACTAAVQRNQQRVIPVLLDNLLRGDAAIQSASYECFLKLVRSRLTSPVELDRMNNLFGYSFASPPSENAQPVERIRNWNEHYTGETIPDLQSGDMVTVQLACLRAVDQQELETIPHLLPLLRHDEVPVRAYAHAAFAALVAPKDPDTGERHPEQVVKRFGFEAAAEPEDRERAVAKIEKWYETVGRAAIERVKAKRNGGSTPAPSAASDN